MWNRGFYAVGMTVAKRLPPSEREGDREAVEGVLPHTFGTPPVGKPPL